MKVTKVKVEPGLYDVLVDGKPIARVAKTGTHLDDYPWDWYFTTDKPLRWGRTTGVTSTLGEAVDMIASRWATFEVTS